jgi:hypothetical protein
LSKVFARFCISSEEMSALCDVPKTATLPEGLAASVFLIALSRICTPCATETSRVKLLTPVNGYKPSGVTTATALEGSTLKIWLK